MKPLFFPLYDGRANSQEHLASTKGITHTDMDELEAELSRLRKLKAEKLTDMVKSAREEISELLEVRACMPFTYPVFYRLG